ncbi:hypothetical protein QPK87_18500 [Kamptonema cortianum]|nr:hypothetical protein [Kamptonema cortianum]
MTVQQALQHVVNGGSLSQEEAQAVMGTLMLGETHHGLIGAFFGGRCRRKA